MVLIPADERGVSFVELIIVMGIILVLAAAAMVVYKGEMYKAYAIVVTHELKRFAKHTQNFYLTHGRIPYEHSRVISSRDPVEGFSPFEDVRIEVVVNASDPYGDSPFRAVGKLGDAVVSIDMKSHHTNRLSEFRYGNVQEKMAAFLNFFVSGMGKATIAAAGFLFILSVIIVSKVRTR